MQGIRSLWDLILMIVVVVAFAMAWILFLLYLDSTIEGWGLWILIFGMITGSAVIGSLVRVMRERSRSLS